MMWFVTLASLIGTVANIHKKWWGFAIWIGTNAAWTVHNAVIKQWPAAGLFSVYFVLAIWGLWKWRKTAAAEAAEDAEDAADAEAALKKYRDQGTDGCIPYDEYRARRFRAEKQVGGGIILGADDDTHITAE